MLKDLESRESLAGLLNLYQNGMSCRNPAAGPRFHMASLSAEVSSL